MNVRSRGDALWPTNAGSTGVAPGVGVGVLAGLQPGQLAHGQLRVGPRCGQGEQRTVEVVASDEARAAHATAPHWQAFVFAHSQFEQAPRVPSCLPPFDMRPHAASLRCPAHPARLAPVLPGTCAGVLASSRLPLTFTITIQHALGTRCTEERRRCEHLKGTLMSLDSLVQGNDGHLLHVKRVAIKGLFRLYNHEVPLNLVDRVTILHGPNGVGKTALLRLVAAAFGGRYTEFSKVPFSRLEIELSDESVIIFENFTKRDKRERALFGLKITYIAKGFSHRVEEITLDIAELMEWVSRFGSEIPFLARMGDDRWVDRRSGDELSSIDVYNRYAEMVGPSTRRPIHFAEPSWFSALRARVGVNLIETQRLLRMSSADSRYGSRDATVVPMVRDYARDLHTRITETLARYATESQSLDQSFPQRLLKVGGPPRLETTALKDRMKSLDSQRAELQKIGLLDSATSSPFDVASLDDLDPAQSNVMSLYVEDTQKKLAVLDDLSRRTMLLLENVNAKFSHKSIRINRDKGFVAFGHDNEPLELDSLSSGEQHELVLLYDLLFRVRPGTLVLIDEPELSLHVAWQKRFLPDLLEIARTADFDAVIATHSPFIVGDRSDLMVPLAADIDA